MKTIHNKKLCELAEKLGDKFSGELCIDDFLNDNEIPCIAQSHSESYSDVYTMMGFNHKYHNKQVVTFYDNEFQYYAVGCPTKIERILKDELKNHE